MRSSAFLLLTLAACSRPAAQQVAPQPSLSASVAAVASSVAPPPSAAPTTVSLPANALDGFELRALQTPCFGPCPVYSVHVDASGHLKAGRTQADERDAGTLSHADLLRLVQAFYDAGFFDLADVYPADATDASTTYLELHSGGRVKKVKHDHSSRRAPKALVDLEKLVEDVTGAVGHGAVRPTAIPGPIPTKGNPYE